MPLAVFSSSIQYVSSVFPFTHMTILLKNIILDQSLSTLQSIVPADAFETIKLYFGVNEIGVFGQNIDMLWLMIGSAVIALALLYFGYANMSRKIKH
jgi:multidrug/hemolysin transport system permease protein